MQSTKNTNSINDNQDVIQLKLHYFLNKEDLHSMNASVYNECEKQFIQMLLCLNKYLDNPIEIEVFAREEGGVIGKYCIKLAKHPVSIAIIAAAATSFFTSKFPDALHYTEETRNKLENIKNINDLIKSNDLDPELFDYVVGNDKELKKHKSNFYKSAKQDNKIQKIELEKENQQDEFPFEKKQITFSEFDNCILREESTTAESEIDAKIYIVAPVLIKGRKDKWKGLYQEEPIEFKLTDKDFLEQVYSHTIKFGNGSYINCKMKVVDTFNYTENKRTINRTVYEVDSYGEDNNTIHKVNKRKKRNTNGPEMPSLFPDEF